MVLEEGSIVPLVPIVVEQTNRVNAPMIFIQGC